MFIDILFNKGLIFIVTLLLARILGPDEFGLIGLISVFIAVGTSLVDSGLSSSIIRSSNIDDSDLSTVFFLNLATGIFIYFLAFIFAPSISAFYNLEALTWMIRIYCISFIISGLSSVQLALLNKELQFKKMMIYNIPGIFLGALLGLLLGTSGFGAWSLIWMYLTTQFINAIILWLFTRWRPSRSFSRQKMAIHFNFGYKLMLSGLLDTLFKNIYNIIIGKYFSVQSLGYYDRANSLNEYPITMITGIINKVAYPVLSQIQNEKEKIALVYKQMLKISFFFTTPLMLGAAAVSQPLFLLILGDKWLASVFYFRIICLASIFYPIHSFNISVLKVYGRSDLFLRLEIVKKIIVTIAILICIQFGLLGLVWSTVFSSLIALIINTNYSSKLIHYGSKQQFFDMLPIILSSSAIFFLMSYFVSALKGSSLYAQLFIPSIFGCISYFVIHYFLGTTTLKTAYNLLQIRKS